MPIALWGLHRFLAARSIRALLIFAAAFALQSLSNGYFMFYLAISAAIVAVYELTRPVMTGRRAAAIGGLAAAGGLIAGALLGGIPTGLPSGKSFGDVALRVDRSIRHNNYT
jgi:hypothetical protein